jgi:hypothetical protein
MTYIQEKSGIGQDRFSKSIKHLIALGYILKVPIFGGVCWIISEIPMQVFNNGTNSEKTKCLQTIRAKTNCLLTNCLYTSCLFHRLRNINEHIINKEIKIEKEINETNNNKSVLGDSDLERVPLQSLATPSVLAPSLHTPSVGVESINIPSVEEKVLVDHTPTEDLSQSDKANEETTKLLVDDKPIPIVPDTRFSEQTNLYKTSKYFLEENLSRVLDIYKFFGNTYPNAFMKIETFEKVLVYLIITQIKMIKRMSLNNCLKTYRFDIEYKLKYVPQLYEEIRDNPEDVQDLLKEYELKSYRQ